MMRIILLLACLPILFLFNCNKKPIERATRYKTLTIYPNPVVDYVNITSYHSEEADTEIQVFDPNGKRIFRSSVIRHRVNTYEIDLKDKPLGQYFVHFENVNFTETKRFIKIDE